MVNFSNKTWLHTLITLSLLLILFLSWSLNILSIPQIVMIFLPVLGTFLGASFAFQLNQIKETEKIRVERIQSLNKALLILSMQYNEILNLKKHFKVELASEDPNSAIATQYSFNMRAIKLPDYSDIKQDFSGLYFLLDEKLPQLLMALRITDFQFYQACQTVNIACEFYVDHVLKKAEDSGISQGNMTLASLEQLFGERIFKTAINNRAEIVKHISGNFNDLPKMLEKLRVSALEIYPDANFVRLEP